MLNMQHFVIMPLPNLPTEVIEEVIDQASDDPRLLQQLALLCKLLLTRARLHLFTGIAIGSVEQMLSSREFLDSHPWVTPLVRRVTLHSSISYDYSKPNIPVLDMVPSHLLTRFPNLRAWRMSTNIFEDKPPLAFHRFALSCYRIYGGHVQELELEGIPIQDVSHFVQLVTAFTALQRLTCSKTRVVKERQTSLLDSENLNKVAKPLGIQHLSVSILAAPSMKYKP